MLDVQHLTRSLAGRRIPDRISLSAAPGELVVLLGESGAGKSGLLRCLAGQDSPESGRITLAGVDLLAQPAHLRPVSFVAQGAALWPQMTVRANLAFGLELRAVPAADVRSRVDEALRLLAVEHLAERRPSTLSGGEQQRVALARALAQQPQLLLLDEPFAWLDARERTGLLALLRRHTRARGAITLLATRDAELASAADQVAVIHAGRLLQIGPPEALHRRPASLPAALATGEANLIPARIIRCGAGEFLAESALGELRGALADPDHEPAEGSPITVMIRPEHLHLAEMPPDENAFAGTLPPDQPTRGAARFTPATGPELQVAGRRPEHPPEADQMLYAWAMPEDVVGLPNPA